MKNELDRMSAAAGSRTLWAFESMQKHSMHQQAKKCKSVTSALSANRRSSRLDKPCTFYHESPNIASES